MRTAQLTLIAAFACVAFGVADRRVAAAQPAAPAAQSPSSSAPSGPVAHQPEVIITGDRAAFASRISTFVNQVTNFDLGDPGRGLARWLDPVCPLVTGLSRPSGEYILQRVSEIAQTAGAPIGGEKCHPNLFIIVTNQPEADLKDLENRHLSEVFGGADPGVIDDFIAIRRPVKTWYDTVQKTPEGLPLLVESFPGISQQYGVFKPPAGLEIFPVRPAVGDSAVTNPWSEASHLVMNAVWVIQRVFVIVDPTQFKGVTRGQLADYVALSGLAQIKLDSHLADDPSILTLFDTAPEAASPGLTQWDQTFLKSVYSTTPKSILQRSAIAHDMVDAIVPP
jgi:hypothetical protein